MARLAELLSSAVDSGTVTVADIVKRSGVERSLVYKYMKGAQPGCTVDTLERLMDAIGAHPSDVFGEREGAPKEVLKAYETLGRHFGVK